MATMELGRFGGERLASSTPIFESIFLYWLVYLALLGLAYRTNPSDLTFRRFLTDLSIQDHLRRLAYPPPNVQSSTLTFDQKISVSLRTPSYHRHDFFIGSLVCVSHRDPQVVEQEKDWWTSRGEWFLGVFGSWWLLDRRYATDWVGSFWRRWRKGEEAGQERTDVHHQQNSVVNPLLSAGSSQWKGGGSSKKKKRGRKKSPVRKIDASPTPAGQCKSPAAQADHPTPQLAAPFHADPTTTHSLANVSQTLMKCIQFRRAGVDNSFTPKLVSRPQPSPWSNGDQKEQPPPTADLGQLTTAGHRMTFSCEETAEFVRLSGAEVGVPLLAMRKDQELHCRKNWKTKQMCAESMIPTRTRSPTAEINHSASELSAEDESMAKSVGEASDEALVVTSELQKELDVKLNAIKFKKNEEDLNKLHLKSSLKHLKEIKELKEFKRLNLNEKLSHVQLTHNNLIVKAQSFKKELETLHVKEGAMNFTFAQNLESVEKEVERTKIELDKNDQEFETLSKNFEAKKAQKMALQQRLNARKLELRVKREPTATTVSPLSKQCAEEASSDLNLTLGLRPIVSTPPLSSVAVVLKVDNVTDDQSHQSTGPIGQTCISPSNRQQPSSVFKPLTHQSHQCTPSLIDPRRPNLQPDPSRNLWQEQVEDEIGVKAKTSSVHPDPIHPAWYPAEPPLSRCASDFFDYRHRLLRTQVGLDQQQQASPFGAIGQQGGSPPSVSKNLSAIQTSTVIEPRVLFEAFAPVSENEVDQRKSAISFGSPASALRPACRLERLRVNTCDRDGWLAGRDTTQPQKIKDRGFGVLEASDPFISPIGDFASLSDSGQMSQRDSTGGSFPLEQRMIGMKRSTERIESRVNVRRHQTSQSVGGIGTGSKGLSSVFDEEVERSMAIQKFDQHPALSLNPSAKAFKFGGRKEQQEYKEKEVIEDGSLGSVTEEEETIEVSSRKTEGLLLEPEDESWTRSLAALRAGAAGSTIPTTSATTTMMMTTLLSPGEALPAASTKSAWAGLFGPIGTVRSRAEAEEDWWVGRERVAALPNRGT